MSGRFPNGIDHIKQSDAIVQEIVKNAEDGTLFLLRKFHVACIIVDSSTRRNTMIFIFLFVKSALTDISLLIFLTVDNILRLIYPLLL